MDTITDITLKVQADVAQRYGDAIPEFAFNSGITRFPKSATWVKASEWEFKGKSYASATYGSWKFPDGNHRIDSFEKKDLKNKAFYTDFIARQNKINQEILEEASKKHQKCRETWKPKFASGDSEALHEYLIDKDIEKPFGSRIDSNGVMMVPVYDNEGFNGVQRIYLNPETGSYEKRFSAGIKIKGSFFPLKQFKFSDTIYVTEGFSTACTIQTAFPNIPVLTVFNAGNIYPAIMNIRKVNASCRIVICADRDKESNTGETFARKTCQKVSSCIYKMPIFKNDNGKWSDYNDLHQFGSLKEVQDQLKITESDFNRVIPLGYNKGKFYFMSTMNRQVLAIAGQNLGEKYLFNLIPEYSFWEKNYPRFDKDDENKENPIGINWTNAGNDLRKQCLEKDIFDWSNIRTSGVWEDSGVYYYHNGHALYDGRKYMDIFSTNLTKNYEAGKRCYSIDKNLQLTKDEREGLMVLFSTLSTKTAEQGLLLLGWVTVASVAGALPWRPHVWLTGDSSAGKSWTMENLISKLLEGFSVFAQGESTEAGVRQKVGNQSTPIIFDEFETDDEKSSEKKQALIALARQASTPSTGDILKGSSEGSAVTFSPNFAMCVSSINLNLPHKQDKNRFTVIEFSDTRANNEQFEKVQEIQKEIITHDISRKLVSYVFHNIDFLIKNFLSVEKILKARRYKGHFCRQYATLIAGILLLNDPIEWDLESIELFIDEKLTISDWHEKTGEEDPEQLKEYILSSFIKVHNEPMTIGEIIHHAKHSKDQHCVFKRSLERYSIRVGETCIYIKKGSNKNFTELLNKTKWHNNWQVSIMRIKGVCSDKGKTMRISGKPTKFFKMEV